MRASVEPLEGNKVKLSVEVAEDEFEKALDTAFKKIAREVRIPGFRPGKAPRRLLEARLGTQVARDEALREALPDYYSKAVREHDVDVIAPPEIEITAGEDGGPVAFDAVVEIRPRVVVPGYGGLRVTINRPEATEAEIDAQIDRLRDQFGELRTVERPAVAGDHVSLNIAGSREGEPAPGLTADDYLYEVGSGTVVPELDEQLRGTKVGDMLSFTAQMPGTRGGSERAPASEGAGTSDDTSDPVDFRVLVKEVKEKLLPDVDDKWANEVSEFDTVEDLRADIAKRITGIRRAQAVVSLRDKVGQALVELVEEDAPEPLVQAEVQQRLQELAMRLSAQGITAEQYLAATGQSQEALVGELNALAVQAVKVDLALRGVADAEGIESTDDDFLDELTRLAERVGQPVERVRKEFERSQQEPAVRSDIRKRKALDWLIEHVEIVDGDGHPIDRADLEPATEGDDEVGDDTGEDRDEPEEQPDEGNE